MLSGLAEAGTGQCHGVPMVLDTPQHPYIYVELFGSVVPGGSSP